MSNQLHKYSKYNLEKRVNIKINDNTTNFEIILKICLISTPAFFFL